MNKITENEARKLISSPHSTAPAITIYLPTHRTATSPHMTEDQIRFKNLFSEALKILDNQDKHNGYSIEFESMCRGLLETREFWEQMSESVLICARPGLFKYYNLPIDCEEFVSVSDHFHLTPVFGLINDMVNYYVLTIAEQDPVLYRGNDYELKPSPVELPKSIKSALNIDEMHVKSVQFASVASPKGAHYHGHGGAKDSGDAERTQYFRMIDDIVNDYTESSLPLILAGVDSEVAEYISISRYTRILSKHIDGHYTSRDTDKLHQKAKRIISEEITSKNNQAVLDKYKQYIGQGNGLASDRIAELKDAADKGRLETLIVGMYKETRDTIRDGNLPVKKIIFPPKDDSAELDYIALRTIS